MKLELEGMTKRFGSVVANDDISLVVEPVSYTHLTLPTTPYV